MNQNLRDKLQDLDFEIRDNRIFGGLTLAHFDETGDRDQYLKAQRSYVQATNALALERGRLFLEICLSL